MPYFDNLDAFINPYYLDVTPSVRAEMYKRAQFYGARTRTAINSSVQGRGISQSNSVEWPYQKMPWAYVTSKTYEGRLETPIILGFDVNSKDVANVNSDENGELTLYESIRNVPKYPLLTGLEISNEGQRGSLLKGKFSFTFFPDMTPNGFDLLTIQKVFFTPGNRVNIGFGWSVSAYDVKVNKLEFVGVIYGFNWSFNANLSLTAEVQVVAPSSLAIGLSGEQTAFGESEEDAIDDPSGKPLPPSSNLVSIIEQDLRAGKDSQLNIGDVEFFPRNATQSKKLSYFKIGLPVTQGSGLEDQSADYLGATETEKAIIDAQQDQALIDTQNTVTDAEIPQEAQFAPPPGSQETQWNSPNATNASQQLRRFTKQFIDNKGQYGPWADKWLMAYTQANAQAAGGEFIGRYVILQEKDKPPHTWKTPESANMASIFNLAFYLNPQTNQFQSKDAKYHDEVVKQLKIATAKLAYDELQQLKNIIFYQQNRFSAYEKFFGMDKKKKPEERIFLNMYHWPQNVGFAFADAYGKDTDRVLYIQDQGQYKGLYSTALGFFKEEWEKVKTGKGDPEIFRSEFLMKPGNQLEKRINNYMSVLRKYYETGESQKQKAPSTPATATTATATTTTTDATATTTTTTNQETKQGLDSTITKLDASGKVTQQYADLMQKYVTELEDLKKDVTADIFKNDGTTKDKIQAFDKKYPDEKFIGGVDIQTIKSNWLLGIDADKKDKKPEEKPKNSGNKDKKKSKEKMDETAKGKASYANKYIDKLIEARKSEKNDGTDKTTELLQSTSNRYKEHINNLSKQNQTNSNQTTGTGDGSQGAVDGAVAASSEFKTGLVGKTYWFVTLGDLTEFANKLLDELENDGEKTYNYQRFRIQCNNNETEYLPRLKSSTPIDIYFPDKNMGGYAGFGPFYSGNYENFLRTFNIPTENQATADGSNVFPDPTDPNTKVRIEDDVINIGNILIGVDFILRTYRGFLLDNSTNIPYKNLTTFFEEIIKGVNNATGDQYQLNTLLFTEPEKLNPKIKAPKNIGDDFSQVALLSIEDNNLARKHTQTLKYNEILSTEEDVDRDPDANDEDTFTIRPFLFEATIFKPLIKNVSISSRPPKELAAAAYVAARGQEANARGGDFREKNLAKPSSIDAQLSPAGIRDEKLYQKKQTENSAKKDQEEQLVVSDGFNEKWSDNYRSLLVKEKRLATAPVDISGRGIGVGGHWLNKAIYPVEFSVTIDGINGFKFGDVIKTTLIPIHYNVDWDMVFTVTKIIHRVTPSTWETTLNTVARLSMDSEFTSVAVSESPLPPDNNLGNVRAEVDTSGVRTMTRTANQSPTTNPANAGATANQTTVQGG